jgi:beta-galactosidase
MHLGVCYYPEHWPVERWPIDAEMMRTAGLDMVRIGEFAWSEMEPAEGHYQWAWLDQAIDVLAGVGLDIVLGTPTAAPPAWLTRKYPDIRRQETSGRYRDHGTRRHYCPNSPRYIDLSRKIVAALGARYGTDPRIIGWQIDNEFGGGKTARCYCDHCVQAFRSWLEKRYRSITALNAAWGNAFWSQTYQSWDQIRPPDDRIDKKNPSHVLDYYRFSTDSYAEYQQYQIDLLRELAPGHFLTTNFMGLYSDLDQFDLAAPYDFITWDNYPTGNRDRWGPALLPPDPGADPTEPVYAYDTGHPLITGMAHELTRALKQKPFWIMEQQPGHINWGKTNTGIRDGTVRLWTWQALAAGADTVVYFRWRPTRFAHEQYHAGLLTHHARPAVGYRDLLRLQAEREMLAQIAATPHTAQVALLFNYDDLWALQLQPHTRDFSYLRSHFAYFQALQQMGIPVQFVHGKDDFARFKLIIAPTAHLVDEALVNQLNEYVTAGGTVLLGVRSGFKTTSNLVTADVLPGFLRALVGAMVEEWQALPDGVGWKLEGAIPNLVGPANYWVETLRPESAETLIKYQDDTSALTVNRVGQGRVFYLGFYPNQEQMLDLLNYLARQLNIQSIADLPPGMIAYARGPYTILMNFTDQPLVATVAGKEFSVSGRDVVVDIGEE